MLDNLFHLIEKPFAIGAVKEILSKVEELVKFFEEDYLKDRNVKNAAIEAIQQLLESLKDKEVTEDAAHGSV